jgi:hypothetical protein
MLGTLPGEPKCSKYLVINTHFDTTVYVVKKSDALQFDISKIFYLFLPLLCLVVRSDVCIHECMYICIYVYMYVFMYVCLYICMCTYCV